MWLKNVFTLLLAGMVCGTLGLQAASGQPSRQRNLEEVTPPQAISQAIGPFYALVIGNSNYQYIPSLKTPISDADAVAAVLRDSYGFNTKLLHDATRVDIIAALSKYRELPENSNLLIYYAGHGYKDPLTQDAYWFPVDAQRDNNANWVSAHDISDDIRAIASRHILIISDSCYSGELSLNRDPSLRLDLVQMMQHKSRNLLASGGNEPVADGGAEGHSIFAAVLLDSLRHMNQEQFNANQIFIDIQQRVGGQSQQLPQYSSIRDSGHDGGEFIFLHAGGAPPPDPTCGALCGGRNDAEQGAAIGAILTRYQSAFEGRDVDALTRLWPDMPASTRRDNALFFEHASAIKMACNMIGQPLYEGNVATIRFSQEMNFIAGGQARRINTPQITMSLRKAAGQRGEDSWQIHSVR